MYLLFVDESGRPDDRAFAVGGVAVRADEWGGLRDHWLATLEAHGWPPNKELKWHGIRTGAVPPQLADAIYSAIAASPITCFVIIVKPLGARQRRPDLFGTREDVNTQSLMWLAERYQRFLSRNDAHGAVVVDSRRPEMDERLRRFFERLQRDGTPCVRLERIIDALLLGPSSHSIGLQTADLGRSERAGRAAGSRRRLPLAQATPPPIRAPPRHRSSRRHRSRHLSAQAEHSGAGARETVHSTTSMKHQRGRFDHSSPASVNPPSRGRTQAYADMIDEATGRIEDAITSIVTLAAAS